MNSKRIHTRTKYLISYLSIFLITLFSFYVTFQVTTRILQKNLFEQNQSTLIQSELLISNRLEEAIKLLQLITADTTIKQALQRENPIQRDYIDNALSIVTLQSVLSNYAAVNSFIDRLVLYNKTENFCVSSSAVYLRMDDSLITDFPQADLMLNVISDALPTLDGVDKLSVTNRNINGNRYFVISQPVKLMHDDQYAMILINLNKLIPYFSNDSERGNFYILDESGKEVFSEKAFELTGIRPDTLKQSESFRSGGKEYTVAQTKSKFNSYTYVSVLPSEQVLSDMAVVERSAFLLLTVSFFLVFAVSIFFTNLNYRPIKKLMKSMSFGINETHVANEFVLIQEHISRIEKRSQEYQSYASEFIGRSLFIELLNGNFNERTKLQSFLASCPFPISNLEIEQSYLLLLAKFNFASSFDTIEDLSVYRKLQQRLAEHASTTLPDTIAVVETNYNHSVILLNLRNMTVDEVAHAAINLSSSLLSEESVHICFSMSNLVENLADLPSAYSNAISSMDHVATVEGASLIRYSDEKDLVADQIYFPPSLQLKLTNLVTSSDTEAVRELLENLYDRNTSATSHSEVSLRLLYFNLCACLVDLISRLSDVPADLGTTINICLNANSNFKINLVTLNNCFLEIATLFSTAKGTAQDSISQDILRFVNENIFNNDLCLPILAEEFKFSESYISTLIKEITGVSFINYVANRRIDEALRLLRESNLSVNEIATQIGYNSTNSFRKAFKKMTGQSPSSYQE